MSNSKSVDNLKILFSHTESDSNTQNHYWLHFWRMFGLPMPTDVFCLEIPDKFDNYLIINVEQRVVETLSMRCKRIVLAVVTTAPW